MDWRSDLPMTVSENGDDENDFDYDDGEIYFFCTVDDDRLVIHDLVSLDDAKKGARTGIGRKLCERLRPYFTEIVASGVGEPYHAAGLPIEEQKPFLFWKAMLDESLIDEIVTFGGPSFKRAEAAAPGM